MSVIIYQHSSVAPMQGGISRMSQFYYKVLTANGYSAYYLSISNNQYVESLKNQLYLCDSNDVNVRYCSFQQIITKYQVSCMIFQDGITPSQFYIVDWAKKLGISVVSIMHSTLRGMYSVKGHQVFSRISNPFITKCLNLILWKFFQFKYKYAYRNLYQLSDRIVLISDRFKQEFSDFTGLTDVSKISSISNPLTLDGCMDIKNKEKIILYVGRLSSQKRIDYLLEIWRMIWKQIPDWKLILVGDGDKRQFAEHFISEHQLQNIDILGFQVPDEYYKRASVFCLTSGYESFGLVLVEAMSYGCVPIVFNSFETAQDIVDNGKTGFLVKPFDLEEYSQKILLLTNNIKLRESMSISSLHKSMQFDGELIGKEWISIIKSL